MQKSKESKMRMFPFIDEQQTLTKVPIPDSNV